MLRYLVGMTHFRRMVGCMGAGAVVLQLGAAQAARSPEPRPEGLQAGHRNPWVQPDGPAERVKGDMTVLEGRLLYEDHRVVARHGARFDLDGRPSKSRKNRPDRRADYLGADFMVVEVFERDARNTRDGTCRRTAFVGRATVQSDGTFSIPVPVRDPCVAEANEPARYLIQATTRHCDADVCVQIGRTPLSPYVLWFGRDTPLVVGPEGRQANTLLFTPDGAPDQNTVSVAANHFASLADTVQAVHVEAGVPFRHETYGPVRVRYPSIWADGRGTSAGLIDINNSGWPRGNLMMHEYAHIVHRRAWGGDYAGFPAPIQPWNGKAHSGETPFIAFKEGWATFMTSYVTGRCFREGYDERDDLVSIPRGTNGLQYPQNHQRALCDWVDDHADHRVGTAVGDRVHTELLELWRIVDETDDRVGEYAGHDPVKQGLDMCDVVEVALSTRGGSEEHIRDLYGLLETNDIWCPRLTDRFASLPVVVESEPVSEL